MARRLTTALGVVLVGAAGFFWLSRPQAHSPFTSPLSPLAFVPRDYALDDDLVFDLSATFTPTRHAFVALREGWSHAEPWGTWTQGESARLELSIATPRPRILRLTCRAMRHPDGREQTVTVRFNGCVCGTFSPTHRPRTRSVDVPQECQRAGLNELVLEHGYHISALETGQSNDPRSLAVGYKRIELSVVETDTARGRIGNLKQRQMPKAEATFNGDLGQVTVYQPGTVVIPLLPWHSTSPVRLDLQGSGAMGPTVQVVGLDGSSWPVEVDSSSSSVELFSPDLPLPEIAGSPCLVMLEVTPKSPDHPVSITSSVLTELARPADPSFSMSLPLRAPSTPPDIVLITLDAARADHFGCYGYDRPTTPHIDELAADSLVFKRAFALAPYTLCSVPTMITGLSFLNHGVTLREHRLHSDATTLAEILRSRGYRTACFSATPHNSRMKGFDQGYEQFFEAWKGVSEADARNPYRLSRAALDWIKSQSSTAPIHVQLHYVPPHEPYDPPQPFNRFGDPAYSGTCDGSLETMKRIDYGQLRPTSADVAAIAALYDGNLLYADDAVGQVLDALRARPRWSNTVVLVTADHGEALYEHAVMGHNSTVYDEMLHVPCVLRLPPNQDSRPVDVTQLVTLSDIVPTMASLAGVTVSQGLDGLDLLAPTREPGLRRNRFFIARSDKKVPDLALRTSRFKAIIRGASARELYDLDTDPGERVNIAQDNPAMFSGLSELLNLCRQWPARLDRPAETGAVSTEDEKMLKALGYLGS